MMKLFSKNSNLCDHNSPTLQTDRQTDRQTTCDRNTALCTKVHRAVIRSHLPFTIYTQESGRWVNWPLIQCFRGLLLCNLSLCYPAGNYSRHAKSCCLRYTKVRLLTIIRKQPYRHGSTATCFLCTIGLKSSGLDDCMSGFCSYGGVCCWCSRCPATLFFLPDTLWRFLAVLRYLPLWIWQLIR